MEKWIFGTPDRKIEKKMLTAASEAMLGCSIRQMGDFHSEVHTMACNADQSSPESRLIGGWSLMTMQKRRSCPQGLIFGGVCSNCAKIQKQILCDFDQFGAKVLFPRFWGNGRISAAVFENIAARKHQE